MLRSALGRLGALLRRPRPPRLGHQARLFVHLDPRFARDRRDQFANRFERQIVRRLEMNATLPHVELLPRGLERRLEPALGTWRRAGTEPLQYGPDPNSLLGNVLCPVIHWVRDRTAASAVPSPPDSWHTGDRHASAQSEPDRPRPQELCQRRPERSLIDERA